MRNRLFAVLAHVVAATHLGFTVFLVVGGVAGRRQRKLVPAHLASMAAMAAIAIPRKACPLTTWEDTCRRRAGLEPHGSFIDHYLIRPWRPQGITPALRVAIAAAWVVPNVWAYASIVGRWKKSSSATTSATASPS